MIETGDIKQTLTRLKHKGVNNIRIENINLTFQLLKAMGSTTVGCMTSLPGNTPHVTAIGWSSSQFVLSLP